MAKISLGVKPAIFPSPVLLIGTYNDDGSVDVMTVAWAGMAASDLTEVYILENHRTTENIRKRKAFTLAIATVETMAQSDYFGIVSGAKDPQKFEKSGFHAVKSEYVDAPVIEEYPLTIECELEEETSAPEEARILGKIKNVLVDEKMLGDNGKMDVSKLHAIVWDNFQAGYYAVGEKVGQSFVEGKKISSLNKLADWSEDADKKEDTSSACSSACGAATLEEEKKEAPSACGSACGAAN
ncbi:flavin reductase [Anaeromicropila herbilytica]|uniref:Flavin oxidoreductase n=1 Tax=Anaeromicropila herbilytica TaxID=2785025 RepID=A0A7R7EJ60_9FIRM|nr:flavin reductase [Anaeromicropila herbilytica]BCN29757.1 flavin oxidoreductase [Anaeromicropila herbilytica]